MMTDRTIYSLLEITQGIRKVIADCFADAIWIRAEMNKLNYYVHSGHCFPELLEKKDGKVVAQMRSTLWRDDYLLIKRAFHAITGQPLSDGVKILFLARISFDPVYGLSLRILDIDPAYTLGDLEREKRETIIKLQQEEIIDNNRKLPFPWIPKRIAVISVESSKGLADFLQILRENPWGYQYHCTLFPSLLQGDKAVDTLTAQLDRIESQRQHFDVVAIIRGGGDDIGLSCFNHYKLARSIATFPLPVLSGIGHATNETVTEMITYHNAITPSRLAEYLIQCFHNVSVPLTEADKYIKDFTIKRLQAESERIRSYASGLYGHTSALLKLGRHKIEDIRVRFRREAAQQIKQEKLLAGQVLSSLKMHTGLRLKASGQFLTDWQRRLQELFRQRMSRQQDRLLHLENMVQSMHPDKVLQRGYSITTFQGRAVTDAVMLKPGDRIKTRLYAGRLDSTIHQIHKDHKDEQL